MSSSSLITLQDIATRVGVSKNTVSRVLNGGVDYARPTFARRAEHIRRVAAEMGYRPNAAARAVLSGRFGAVSLLLSPKSGLWLPPGLLRGLSRAAQANDLQLVVSELPDHKLTDDRYVPKALSELSVDGLLIDYLYEMPTVLSDLLQRHRIPAIYLNDRRAEDCVYPDDHEAFTRLTRELIAMGHRKITYYGLHGSSSHYSERDRLSAYEQVMTAAGLQPISVVSQRSNTIDQRAQLAHALLHDHRPTAVITYAETHAQCVVGAALMAGLRIPQDLSVTTVHSHTAVAAGIPIDTFHLPQQELAEASMSALITKIAEPTKALEPLAVPFSAPARVGSVCPPLDPLSRL